MLPVEEKSGKCRIYFTWQETYTWIKERLGIQVGKGWRCKMETAFYVSILLIARLLVPVSILLLAGTLLTRERTGIS